MSTEPDPMTAAPDKAKVREVLATLNDTLRCLTNTYRIVALEEVDAITLRDFAQAALSAPEAGWVLCSDRLPDDGQECWITRMGHVSIETFHAAKYTHPPRFGVMWVDEINGVIAWSPISKPAPYIAASGKGEGL